MTVTVFIRYVIDPFQREAFAEYRRALRLGDAFDWPHACTACGAPSPAWQDRCPRCRRWNTVRPAPPRR